MRNPSLVLPLAAAEDTCTPSCNQTDLPAWYCVTRRRRWMADMLVISSSVRVLDGVHCRASDPWPAIALHLVLVEVPASLEDWLVHAPSSCADTDDGPVLRWHGLTRTRWQADARLLAIIRVPHDHARTASGTSQPASIGSLLLAHGNNGALRHLAERHHVADGKLCLCAGIYKLSGVEALDSNPALLPQPVLVWIAEGHLAHGSSSARVVEDLFHESLDEAIALNVVDLADLGRTLAEPGLRGEDQALALAATSDDATHGSAVHKRGG